MTDDDEILEGVKFVKFGDNTKYIFPGESQGELQTINLCNYGESQLPVYNDVATTGNYISMLQQKRTSLADTFNNANKILNDTSLTIASEYRDVIQTLNSAAASRTKLYDEGFTLQISSAIETYRVYMDRVARMAQHDRTSVDDFRNILIYNDNSYTVGADDSLILKLGSVSISTYVLDEDLPGTDATDNRGVLTLGSDGLALQRLISGTSPNNTFTALSEKVSVIKPSINVNDAYLLTSIHREAGLLEILHPSWTHGEVFNEAYVKVMTKLFDETTVETLTNINLYIETDETLRVSTDTSSPTYQRIRRKYYQQYVLFPAVDDALALDRNQLKHNAPVIRVSEEWNDKVNYVIQHLTATGQIPDDLFEGVNIESALGTRVYYTYYKNPDVARPDTDDDSPLTETEDNHTLRLSASYLAYDSVYDDVFDANGNITESGFTTDGGYDIYKDYFEVYNQQFLDETVAVPEQTKDKILPAPDEYTTYEDLASDSLVAVPRSV